MKKTIDDIALHKLVPPVDPLLKSNSIPINIRALRVSLPADGTLLVLKSINFEYFKEPTPHEKNPGMLPPLPPGGAPGLPPLPPGGLEER
jgi:hypothetical protein